MNTYKDIDDLEPDWNDEDLDNLDDWEDDEEFEYDEDGTRL
jgi:hypothetical protein